MTHFCTIYKASVTLFCRILREEEVPSTQLLSRSPLKRAVNAIKEDQVAPWHW
jgi:hypothetical protein